MNPAFVFIHPAETFSRAPRDLDFHIPLSIQRRIKSALLSALEEGTRCSICHDSLSEGDSISTRCYHHFHAACFQGLVSHRLLDESEIRSVDCPHCRRSCMGTYGIQTDPRNGPIWRRPILEDYPDSYSTFEVPLIDIAEETSTANEALYREAEAEERATRERITRAEDALPMPPINALPSWPSGQTFEEFNRRNERVVDYRYMPAGSLLPSPPPGMAHIQPYRTALGAICVPVGFLDTGDSTPSRNSPHSQQSPLLVSGIPFLPAAIQHPPLPPPPDGQQHYPQYMQWPPGYYSY